MVMKFEDDLVTNRVEATCKEVGDCSEQNRPQFVNGDGLPVPKCQLGTVYSHF